MPRQGAVQMQTLDMSHSLDSCPGWKENPQFIWLQKGWPWMFITAAHQTLRGIIAETKFTTASSLTLPLLLPLGEGLSGSLDIFSLKRCIFSTDIPCVEWQFCKRKSGTSRLCGDGGRACFQALAANGWHLIPGRVCPLGDTQAWPALHDSQQGVSGHQSSRLCFLSTQVSKLWGGAD